MKSKRLHSLAAFNRFSQTQPSLRANGAKMLGRSMLAFLATFTFAEAKILQFDLSPSGSGNAVGLSPANEVPAVVATGSGGEISGGVTFDTDTSTLTFVMGYGTAAGFTNLTGSATGLHLHGPAAAGAEASVLFDLASGHFPSVNPLNGGLVYGSILFSPTQAADLLDGLNYVNLHTSANPGGEIRGQLVLANSAPEIIGPDNATVECGVPITYSAAVSDYDGDAVTAVWSVNGVNVETDSIPATGTPSNVQVTYRAKLPMGANILTLTATDSEGNETIFDSFITVEDTIAPEIISVSASPETLWPPNHKMVTVRVSANVKDACGDTTWEVISVKSSQPENGKGDGNTDSDFKIIDEHTVLLRAERAGNDKGGRVYTITIRATDEAGNKSALETVKVTVPHNSSK